LGIKLATDADNGGKGKFVCRIVGNGSYMFGAPGSVYWISQRYKIPVLTIVLNNNGWNAPRKSLLLVHPYGEGSHVTNEELNISFAPTPDWWKFVRGSSEESRRAGGSDKESGRKCRVRNQRGCGSQDSDRMLTCGIGSIDYM
jgi:hypothetical protein